MILEVRAVPPIYKNAFVVGCERTREAVIIEWTDRDPADTRFEGTARELLRLQLPSPIHPLGEMTFNPIARRGEPEWRVMYVGVGDSGTGEQRDVRRLTPQRLCTRGGRTFSAPTFGRWDCQRAVARWFGSSPPGRGSPTRSTTTPVRRCGT